MSDGRAERLRDKRNESKAKVQSQTSESSKPSEPSETDEPEQPGEPDEPDETGETGEPDEPDEPDESDKTPVKDEQVGTYLYLPEAQHEELRYQYKRLSAEYEREFGEDFEKNRHFYPLVVEHGLDGLDGTDAQDVRDMLEGLDY